MNNKALYLKTKDLISILGGPTKTAKLINSFYNLNLSRQAISNWNRRGIPAKYVKFLCLHCKDRQPENYYKPSEIRPDIF